MLFLLEKAVKNPGSRGGHPKLNKEGHLDYHDVAPATPKIKKVPVPKISIPALAAKLRDNGIAPLSNAQLPSNGVQVDPTTSQAIATAINNLTKNSVNVPLPTDEASWQKTQLQRLGDPNNVGRTVGWYPDKAIAWANDPTLVTKMFNDLPDNVRKEALNGLTHVENNMELARHHAITKKTVIKHFVWAILATASAPYQQEGAYIDLEKSGLEHFVNETLNGNFDLEEYHHWLKDNDVLTADAVKKGYLVRPKNDDPKAYKGLAPSSPGKGVTNIVNRVGILLDCLSKRGTDNLTAMFNDPRISGKEARRIFWRSGYQKMGINNKILSFAVSMLGKPDIVVVDRWQGRLLHPKAYEALQNAYHAERVRLNDGKELDTSKDGVEEAISLALTSPYNSPGGPAGLATYEGTEDLLGKAVAGLPVGKNGKILGTNITPSIFALHWLSWVSNFGDAVGHHSLDTAQEENEQGLSSRPQQVTPGDFTPDADEELDRQGIGFVVQGDKELKTFGSKYQRGNVPNEQLSYKASMVPTEFVPGTFPDAFGSWLKAQSKETKAQYSEFASHALEPLFRKLATTHGLAVSVNEGFGGFDGNGNANSQATLVPMKKMSEEEQDKSVAGFAADLGWAFKQDMAVYGHMVPKGTVDANSGYDFQLKRALTATEAQKLGEVVKREVEQHFPEGSEQRKKADAGYTFLPGNNRVRFINFTGFSIAPLGDETFREDVERGLKKAIPGILEQDNSGDLVPYTYAWKGGAIENNWEKDPAGTGYAEARTEGTSVQSAGSNGNGQELASQLRVALEGINKQFQEKQQSVSKSLLLLEKAHDVTKEARNASGEWTRGDVSFGQKVHPEIDPKRTIDDVIQNPRVGDVVKNENGNTTTVVGFGRDDKRKKGVKVRLLYNNMPPMVMPLSLDNWRNACAEGLVVPIQDNTASFLDFHKPAPVLPAVTTITPLPRITKKGALQPQGTPISSALTLPSSPLANPLRIALTAVDSVHGDGVLPTIPVKVGTSGAREGAYYFSKASGKPSKISISRKADSMSFSFVHEIGHFIDQQAIGKGDFASEKANESFPEMAEWHAAVNKSNAVKSLRELSHKPGMDITGPDGKQQWYRLDTKYIRYLCEPSELFSRSYSQYIAERSGSPELLAGLDSDRKSKGILKMPVQWDDQDFIPIATAFDSLFKRMGWLK